MNRKAELVGLVVQALFHMNGFKGTSLCAPGLKIQIVTGFWKNTHL